MTGSVGAILKTVVLIHTWEWADMQGQLRTWLLCHVYNGLEHLWVWVSTGILEQCLADTNGQLNFWGSQKSYVDFRVCGGQGPNPLHCSRISCYSCLPLSLLNIQKLTQELIYPQHFLCGLMLNSMCLKPWFPPPPLDYFRQILVLNILKSLS